MGAYENPIAVIDRESGKIWANAISNLGNQAADVIETKSCLLYTSPSPRD